MSSKKKNKRGFKDAFAKEVATTKAPAENVARPTVTLSQPQPARTPVHEALERGRAVLIIAARSFGAGASKDGVDVAALARSLGEEDRVFGARPYVAAGKLALAETIGNAVRSWWAETGRWRHTDALVVTDVDLTGANLPMPFDHLDGVGMILPTEAGRSRLFRLLALAGAGPMIVDVIYVHAGEAAETIQVQV